MKQIIPARYHPATPRGSTGERRPYTAEPAASTTATDTVPSTMPSRMSLPTIAPALTPDARNRRVTPSSRAGRDVHRKRDQAEGGEHHADVAGEVVVVRRHAAELRVGHLAEDAGEHEHGGQREADQADGHHRLAGHQPEVHGGEPEGRGHHTGVGSGRGQGDGGHR